MAAIESSGIIGSAKLLTFGAAGLGALVMAIFRPPKTRKEMIFQGFVALASSYLFGDFAVDWVSHMIGIAADPIAIHGFVGAISWGVFGGIAHYRDNLSTKDIKDSIKDVKN